MSEPEEELAAKRVGTQVGSWTLERVLGIGSMASVFLGRRADGSVAAVKVLHPSLWAHHEVKNRFLREGPIGSALAALGPLCQGLPQVLESGVAPDGTAFMAMELLVGEELFDRMVRLGVLPPEEVLLIAHKVLDVLVLAHAYGIVHRDLKPENLHISPEGRVKVLDFGVARVLEALPDGTGVLPTMARTRTGTALGSCEYMAPEQALGRSREIDGRTDLFGLGATMFRLLSGKGIHGDLRDMNLLVAASTHKAPGLATIAPALPPTLCEVVDRALAFLKSERYPDAATMRFDVNALRRGQDPPYVRAIREGRARPGMKL